VSKPPSRRPSGSAKDQNAAPSPALGLALVGRQAIVDKNRAVFAYQLLYRDPDLEPRDYVNPNAATATVILNTFVEIGVERVVGPHPMLIEFTLDALREKYATLLPSDRVILQIPASTKPEITTLAALRYLRSHGYRIALGGVLDPDHDREMASVVNMVKIDVRRESDADLERWVGKLHGRGVLAIAGRVETPERYQIVKGIGFDYFQGSFLEKPQMLEHRRPMANLRKMLELLRALNDPGATVADIERIVRADVTFSYRLLRCLNSAAFCLPQRIETVRQAIVMLGFENLRTWTTVLTIATQPGRPTELVRIALLRARMCEALARLTKHPSPPVCFTVGFFSILDALLDRPLRDVLEELPLTPDVNAAVLHHEGPAGAVLACVLAYERGDWDKVKLTGIGDEAIGSAWLAAVRETDDLVAELVS
jgi:EAL and modified HD-GYP domain-containing signal transduction protein